MRIPYAMILVIVMSVFVFPTPAQADRRSSQGIQMGQAIDVATCTRNPNVALLLDDQPFLDRTSWVRIDMRAAGSQNWGCDLAGAYQGILDELHDKASWIDVIALASNEFVWGQTNAIPPQDFADAAIRVACDDHYGRVDVWEIWNEPSYPATYVSPDTFAQLIGLSSRAIRQDCDKEVISGGINPEGDGVPDPRDYLAEVNAAFEANQYGNFHSFVNSVNGIGLHPYVLPMDEQDTEHQRLADFGWAISQAFPDEPLYVTEVGWRIGEVDEQAQCDNLVHAFDFLQKSGVEAATWFTLRDFNIAEQRYGLYDDAGTARLAYQGYLNDDCSGPTDGAYVPATESLQWIDSGSTATYEVALARAGETAYTIFKTVSDKQVALPTFTPLVPNGTYTWKVTAIRNGKRYPSKKWTFTYLAKPVTPPNFTATVLGPNSVRLNWTDVAGETGYEVTNNVTSKTAGTNATTLTWDSIPGGTYMCFRGRASNATGPSPWTAWACVTTTGVLTAPTGQAAVATSTTTVKVSWTDNSSNETGFEITDNLTTRTVAANVNTMVWDNLAPGTHKCFRVRAYNASGFSFFTPWACVDTPSIPAVPTGQTAVATGANTVKVSWIDSSSNETGFDVGIYGSPVIKTFPAGTQTMVWDGLAPGTNHCFQVRSFNSWGVSAWTTPWACAVTGVTVPAVPTGVAVAAVNGNVIKVGWVDNSSNETGFEVLGNGVIRSYPANTTAINWDGIPFGTLMCFQVRAFNAAGTSAWTTPAQCTSTPAPPFAPSGVTAVATGTTTVKVSWQDNSNNESNFEILYNGVSTATVGANVNTFVWGGLPPAKTACFQVRAVNAIGASGYTAQVCAVTATPPPPAMPSNVVAAQTGSTLVKVTWADNAGNETGYQITDGATTWTLAANTTVFVRNGRPPVPQVCFQVRSFHEYGYSAWTSKVCTKTV